MESFENSLIICFFTIKFSSNITFYGVKIQTFPFFSNNKSNLFSFLLTISWLSRIIPLIYLIFSNFFDNLWLLGATFNLSSNVWNHLLVVLARIKNGVYLFLMAIIIQVQFLLSFIHRQLKIWIKNITQNVSYNYTILY